MKCIISLSIAILGEIFVLLNRVLESAAHRAALASGARKIASASASGARKKNNERERERRSEKSGSAGGERRSSNLRK